jgi:hypothetical protein
VRLPWQAATIVFGIPIATFAVGASLATARPQRSPAALQAALLKAKVTKLPHGYRSPVVSKYTPTGSAKSRHATGGVQIVADGGNEAFIYQIFATAADAKLDWANANFVGATTSAAPSSIPKPSIVANTSAQATSGGKKITFGLTDVGCLDSNLIVEAVTSSATSTKHGDVAGAVALEQYAVAHLAASN